MSMTCPIFFGGTGFCGKRQVFFVFVTAFLLSFVAIVPIFGPVTTPTPAQQHLASSHGERHRALLTTAPRRLPFFKGEGGRTAGPMPPRNYHSNGELEHTLPLVYQLNDMEIKIPHIVHQMWKHSKIPRRLANHVKSWNTLIENAGWQYWFWTDGAADAFIKKYYPKAYSLYRSYPLDIHRADAVRYFILYQYGGVYADLDMELKKSPDVLTRTHHCILAQEPVLHAVVLYGITQIANNALMGSIPQHPFFKLVMDQLESFNKTTSRNVVYRTGPMMLNSVLEIYRNQSHLAANSLTDSVFLAPPDYFLPLRSPKKTAELKTFCDSPRASHKKLCSRLDPSVFIHKEPDPFTVHHYSHTWIKNVKSSRDQVDSVDIREIISRKGTVLVAADFRT